MDLWDVLEYLAWALSAVFALHMIYDLYRVDTTYDNELLTSSREDRDLVESYRLGVNAYVVKPVDFHAFADAVKEVGMFWAVVNEPPPVARAAQGDEGTME